MVRFMVHTKISKRDTSGNCYMKHYITSSMTKKTIVVNSGCGSDNCNILSFLRENGLEWSEIYVTQEVISKRDFKKIFRYLTKTGIIIFV